MRVRFKDLFYITIVTVLGLKLFWAHSENTIDFEAIGERYQVEGQFGVPVGYSVTLEVKKIGDLFKTGSEFLVESIDGKAPQQEIVIVIDCTEHWPIGATATVTGNEIGRLRCPYRRGQEPRQILEFEFFPAVVNSEYKRRWQSE